MAEDHSVTSGPQTTGPQISGPWSAPLRLVEIGRGLNRKLQADAAVRARVARALDLAELDRLDAEIQIAPAAIGFEAKGRIRADAVQTCGITLEPLPAAIDADFTLRFVEPADAPAGEPAHEIEIGLEDDDPPDVIEDGVLDLGALVVEQLSLALDPFPRKPGAVFEAPDGPAEPSPFAVLSKLKIEGKE